MSLQTYKWLLGVERAEFYPRYILTAKKSSHELENHKKSVLILSLMMPHPVLRHTNIKFDLNSKPVEISPKKEFN